MMFQDWDNTVSTPLVGKGSPAPNIISPCDKHSTSENSNGFITFVVEGDPAPEVQWFKVKIKLQVGINNPSQLH